MGRRGIDVLRGSVITSVRGGSVGVRGYGWEVTGAEGEGGKGGKDWLTLRVIFRAFAIWY